MATVIDTQEVVEYEDYIDQQIAKTSFHVKTVDLFCGLILLGLVVLCTLFAMVVIDHWILGLSFAARVASLVTVVGLALLILATRIFPPLIRSINPEYSAQAVERSFPSLKNGLVNFLFFRDRKDEVRESVYDGMRAQAATGLAGLPIDSAVDRSQIIKLGYGLVAITAIWVAYILFSPKNPLQTLQRIVTPWRDIQRPSQVDISDVTPGNIDVFQGQTVEVRAKVAGLKDEALPAIEFSTLDGQLTNQRITMRENGVAGHFVGVLSASESGIQQNLQYRIVAGDAISRTFEVHAVEAPHIVVDHVEYDFPSYTGQPDEIVQGEGDIRAIEGTRVTIHGKANQLIRRGHVELLPALDENVSANEQKKSKQASLSVDGENGEVRLSLRLDSKRKQSIYRGYKLHFTNEEDLASLDAIEHAIEVIPDLRPIVQILTPKKRTIEVPENGWQKIEVRAVDPDFQLTQVQLAARTRNRAILKQNLLLAETATTGHSGQFVASYRFVPSDHDLKEGDVVEYLAVAKDNRHSSLQNKLEPNRTISSKQYIRIIAADPMAEKPPGEGAQADPNEQRPENPPAEQQPNDPGDKPQQGGEQNSKTDDPQNQTSDGQNQNQDQQGAGGEQSQPDEQQESQGGEGGESGGVQQPGNTGGEAEQQNVDSGAPGESQSQNDSSDSQSGSNGGEQNADSQDENNGSQNGIEDSQESDQSNSDSDPSNTENNSKSNGGGDPSDNQPFDENRGARNDEPLPASGERDGEVVERIRKHMEEKGELDEPGAEQPKNDQGSEDNQPSGADDRQDQSGSEGKEPNDPNDSSQQGTYPNESQSGDPDKQPNQPRDSERGKEPKEAQPSEKNQQTGDNPQPGEQPGQEPGDQPGQQEGKQPEDGSGGKSKEGQPSSNEGAPGNQGDRHTDAATSADQPGESPPDGKQPTGDEDQSQDRKPGSQTDNSNTREGSSNPDPNSDRTQQEENGLEKRSGENGSKPDSQNSDQQDHDEPSDAENPEGQGKGDSNGEKGSQPLDSNKSKEDQNSGDKPSEGQPSNQGTNQGSSDSNPTKGDGHEGQSGQKSNSGSQNGNPSSQGTGTHNGEGGADGEMTGDDANLEYTRKATDLVLEYLRDQENKPDQALLDKLGWDSEDVNKFVRRWDEMKKKAGHEGAQLDKGKRELDDVLRSMGLQAPDSKVRRSSDQNDTQRNNRNTGRRTKVPADQLDPFRAFQRALQNK